ncbi:hypothetical protein B0H17DRAFT_1203632 [Mycena rosella]|uniref:Uncharacterized protein n=1 Tax=Mycena rosella TaxID=1033263 RepID=A0AAD7GEM0_MYCRO|nr:hypothetical protein B0H17DRAFT_1203632 [Mycena rosella]
MSQNSPQPGSSRSDLDKMTPRLSQSQPAPARSRSALGVYAPSLPTPHDVRELAHGPDGYLFNYDNVNLSTSIFVEQRDSAPAKVQSGTYPIIYRLRNPNPAALNLSILLARTQNATDLDFNTDLCPSFEQSRAAHHQFCSYVIRVLCRYEKRSALAKTNSHFSHHLDAAYQTTIKHNNSR